MNLHTLISGDLRRKFRSVAVMAAITLSPLALSAQQVGNAGAPPPDSVAVKTTPVTPALILAPPPENEEVALPHRFTPLQSFATLFNTAEERERNIFFTVSRDAIAEFRTLTNNADARGPLTRAEQKMLSDIRLAARADAKKYRIPLPVAATLHFAAQQTGTDFEAMVTRLQENSGNVMNVSPARLHVGDVYKFNVSTWLYLVKTHGAQHGLGFFADKIDAGAPVPNALGQPTVRLAVNDPAVLRQLVAMRSNPRINALLGAEYVAHEAEIPQTAYRGMNYVYDMGVAAEQQQLMIIGFDLGIRGADGIRGPLSAAAKQEFALMTPPLMLQGQTVETLLADAARQAVADAERYSTVYNAITPATAFAVRHASRVSGMDFGYLMQLAGAESGFDAGISASTSSAAGLFQFIDNSWLVALYSYGEKYGLGDIARTIEVERNRGGEITTARINDPLIEKYALSLRTDPRIMSLMGAEFAKENRDNLQAALPRRNITRTDQYLAHFLGSSQAVTFITQLNRNPDAAARTAFPAAAHANRGVFYKRGGIARSLEEVYDLFRNKFSSTFFDNPVTQAPATPPRVPMPRPREPS